MSMAARSHGELPAAACALKSTTSMMNQKSRPLPRLRHGGNAGWIEYVGEKGAR